MIYLKVTGTRVSRPSWYDAIGIVSKFDCVVVIIRRY